MKKSFIRSAKEIENIKKACRVSDSAFNFILRVLRQEYSRRMRAKEEALSVSSGRFILKKIKVGISEKELAKILSEFLRKRAHGISFRTIVAFGKNSSEIHHKVTSQKLKFGDVIMLDFGAKVNGFCSDITRTVFFGKATKKQKNVYKAVLKAQEKSLNYLKSSVISHKSIKGFEVDKVARDYIRKQGFPSIPHGLGHSIGRKVHQGPRLSPKSKFFLKPGMVFTIEPAVYLKKFGIRIEDEVLIKKSGIEVLTNADKKLIEL